MHDTPIKAAFNRPQRDLSHGCIRLEKPAELLSYLGEKNKNLSQEIIEPYMNSTETKYLALNKDIPLHITFIRAWVDEKGNVQFRENFYQQDEDEFSACAL